MGSRTERMLLEDVIEMGYGGLKTDMNLGGMHSGHDGGDLIIGKPYREEVVRGFEWDDEEELFRVEYGPNGISELYVIEEKYKSSSSRKSIQVKTEKTKAMIKFAEVMGATPILAVRWSTRLDFSPGSTHYLIDAREIDYGDIERFSVHPDDAAEWESTEEYFSP